MGIPALWDTIRRYEEAVPIAQLAEDHHRRHGKPLRIAVDEADWRFNNLTPQQVYAIRDATNQHAFQGVEKAMFYRLCRLLTLNIQLVFVFDGPGRPWKRGKRGQGRINYEERRLLQELLKYLGVPYHEAPGEAEAECARMQILGIVDAVWSQDSDCLMFGCTLWFHDHRIAKNEGVTDRSKENTKKNGKYASVVRAIDMKERYNLDREGLVLFAMLVGGDYDQQGLPQCGPGIALQAVKEGLGRSLCECRNQFDCRLWSQELAQFLNTSPRGRSIPIPSLFPDYDILKKYYRPKVTSDQDLLLASRLNLDYIRPIQEHELLKLTSERFNIWGRLYMNWIGPVLLTRDLASRDSSKPKEMVHEIRIPKQRSKTEHQPSMRTFERKITFSPFRVTSLCRDDFEGSQFGHWNGDDKVLFDPKYRVECEMPEYWLRKTLPAEVLNSSLPTPKPHSKRKRTAGDVEEAMESPCNKRIFKPRRGLNSDTSKSHAPQSTKPDILVSESKFLSKMSKPDSTSPTSTRKSIEFIELSDSEDDETLRVPSIPSSRQLLSIEAARSSPGLGPSTAYSLATPSISQNNREDRTPFDLSNKNDEYDEVYDEDLQLALRLSMQEASSSMMHSSSKGKFDDIFAMREEGRSVEGLAVPAWSLDQALTSDLLPPDVSTPSRQARGIASSGSNPSHSATHANFARANSGGLRTQPSSKRSKVVRSLVPSPTRGEDIIARPEASSTTPTKHSLDDIRAARLRHFGAHSETKIRGECNVASSPPRATLPGHEVSSTVVPASIECIDLTED
ncbi:hypothetical protein COCMIDRAFT_36119 [Bipolaris oryzae ATCC 44560]|uniref:XPG-I domain-containing protein n=1 Tax=Bipolaris oryzae ATCC 44560 TaxID=930090 RepID=W6Z3F9_COCMI|nr:uncharacterized protein COCMIDRAFT_36119 [Bipolaris oryzae ATCC 44560]EUC46287.1 hypothetical protein COCMIDRAFT_36119 [Bipolaris oryzae ATCC 44560]